jgi:hypothetical protein
MMLRRYHPGQTSMDQPTLLQRMVRGMQRNLLSNTCVAQMNAQKSRQPGTKSIQGAASAAAGELLSNTAVPLGIRQLCDTVIARCGLNSMVTDPA